MTAEPLARPDADPEQTAVIQSVEAPLPPYAQARTHPPMSPSAPTPPPAYPPAAPVDPGAPPPTVADAMVEISMPPLAAVADAAPAAPAAPADTAVVLAKADPQPPAADQPATQTTVVDVAGANVTSAGPAPAATVAAAMPAALAETITCPECGTVAQVALNRRESMDFCRTCDYPLFWTPSKVVRDGSGVSEDSLRRLPGQAGRATIASLPCPFCYEPNALSAQTCIRCNRPMHPVEEPPPPAPVYVAPEPVIVEPPKKVAWWVWALLAFGAAALIVLIVLIGTGTIG